MKKKIHDCKGSLTLEATIVFPIFLSMLLLLINVVNISLTYVAMDHAVSETVKQIAVQVYPLKYLKADSSVNSTQKNKFTDYSMSVIMGAALGQPQSQAAGSDIATIIGNEIKDEVTNITVNALTKGVILAKIKELYPLHDFAERDIKITVLNMYNPNNMPEGPQSINKSWDNKDIAVTVEYKIKPLVPFLPLQEIILSNSAVERAWVDD